MSESKKVVISETKSEIHIEVNGYELRQYISRNFPDIPASSIFLLLIDHSILVNSREPKELYKEEFFTVTINRKNFTSKELFINEKGIVMVNELIEDIFEMKPLDPFFQSFR
jgi:hypothetical protein